MVAVVDFKKSLLVLWQLAVRVNSESLKVIVVVRFSVQCKHLLM
jgi:hypothetical protein